MKNTHTDKKKKKKNNSFFEFHFKKVNKVLKLL